MSILTDTDLRDLMRKGSLTITDFDEERLTPIGYNLTVGDYYLSASTLEEVQVQPNQPVSIGPGEMIAIRAREEIALPSDRSISGFIQSKIKMLNAGFGKFSTTLDPDHHGPLLVHVQNLSPHHAQLEHGKPFCTVILIKNNSPSTKRSNNSYEESEIVEDLRASWSLQARTRRPKVIRKLRPFLPVLFILTGGALAWSYLGTGTAFGGVMTAIATVGVLLERLLNDYMKR